MADKAELTVRAITDLLKTGITHVVCERIEGRFFIQAAYVIRPMYYRDRMTSGQSLLELLNPSAYKIIHEVP